MMNTGIVEEGMETTATWIGLCLTSILLIFAYQSPNVGLNSGESPLSVFCNGMTILVVLGWMLCAVSLFDDLSLKAEKVVVRLDIGEMALAEVRGACKIAIGQARKTSIRFYLPSGDSAWSSGDGWIRATIIRSNSEYKVLRIAKSASLSYSHGVFGTVKDPRKELCT